MKVETLEKDILDATSQLLQLAKASCWNKISDDCVLILSEIEEKVGLTFDETRKKRKLENERKTPKAIIQIFSKLERMYETLYDINLFVYRAEKKRTIVEIQYFLKSQLEESYRQSVKDNEPMLHCKVPIPPYCTNGTEKFDVNWELRGLRYQWKMFEWNKRMLEKSQ